MAPGPARLRSSGVIAAYPLPEPAAGPGGPRRGAAAVRGRVVIGPGVQLAALRRLRWAHSPRAAGYAGRGGVGWGGSWRRVSAAASSTVLRWW